MKIVIDARMYGDFGIGRYNKNLIYHLQKIDPKNEYFILHKNEDFKKYHYDKNFKKVLANFHWYGVTEQIKLPQILKKIRPDLVHFPHFNVPLFYRGNYVVTIHDLIHQHFQLSRASTHGSLIYQIKKVGLNFVLSTALKKSQKILTPSYFVKKQLVNEWNMPMDKMVVTPEGVDDNISAIEKKMNQIKIDQVLRKFGIKPPYIYYVGSAHPHKNIEGLVKIFLELRKNYQYLTLVLSGSDNYFWQRIKREFNQKDIIYTGNVSDGELVALYKNAQTFVIPSFEEGFGIPILEAFECGCPVVSSNAGSLKEVGGDAAIYFDPGDQGEMGDKIDQVLRSEKLRKELIEKGKKRVKLFSWEKLAKQTLEVYQNAGSDRS